LSCFGGSFCRCSLLGEELGLTLGCDSRFERPFLRLLLCNLLLVDEGGDPTANLRQRL
jgi:hypothetical protein